MPDEDIESDVRLAKWYAAMHPRRLDIVGDFGGKQLFLVDGDSLLLHSLAASRVDYDVGFQLLHAIFSVESFLGDLRVRGCNFHVIFFDNQRELCVPSTASESVRYKYQMTRIILVQHLRRLANGGNGSNDDGMIFSFPSINSRAFHQHLDQHPVVFLLCHDGNTASGSNSLYQTAFHYMIYQFLQLGHSIALIDSIDFRSSRVIVSIIRAARALKPLAPWKGLWPRKSFPNPEPSSQLDWTLYNGGSYRELLTTIALSRILQRECSEKNQTISLAMILHSVTVSHTRLAERAVSTTGIENGNITEDANAFLQHFCQEVASVLVTDPDNSQAERLNWDVFDIIDGRLFLSLYAILARGEFIPAHLVDMAKPLIRCVEDCSGVSLLNCSCLRISPNADTEGSLFRQTAPCRESSQTTILPFNHELLDKFLAPIQLQTAQLHEETNERKIFQELTHWHNAKRTIDPKKLQKKPGFFARKRNQKFMADTLVYAASLTNATGKIIEPRTIVRAPVVPPKKAPPGRAVASSSKVLNNQTGKKTKGGSGKENALETASLIQAQKSKKKDEAKISHWCAMAREFGREDVLTKRFQKAAKYFAGLTKEEKAVIGAEVSLFLCDILYRAWEKQSAGTSDSQAMGIASLLFDQVMRTTTLPVSTREAADVLGILGAIVGVPSGKISSRDMVSRRLSFDPRVSQAHSRPLTLTNVLRFQLEHCGPFLERTFDSRKDDRVPFEPDAWQRAVLDGIDADNSLFIVAPTSSGKTFISFYAMEKTLRTDDDGVLIYVAPTKALVNQIAAEIQARFHKKYQYEGKCVWAIHTRDYRVNSPTGCQILVTVPHILQIMLLSPSNLAWSKRVRRIIFDEVHCIGQAEDGIIWEQLLLMAPCPMIALSATVGNPEEFCEWLRMSQTSKGFEFKMITHNTRYSDLRAFQYVPSQDFEFKGLCRADHFPIPGLDRPDQTNSNFRFIHPIAALVNKTGVNLEELSLEPRDAWTLWQCMKQVQTESFPLDDALDPSRVFSGVPRKSDVLVWVQKLKRVLSMWMQDANSPFDQVQASLNRVGHAGSGGRDGVNQARPRTRSASNQPAPPDELVSVFALLCDLHKENALPAILFNYDRAECERTLDFVLHELISAERAWKESSSEWQKKMRDYEQWKMSLNKRNTTREVIVVLTKDERVREEANVDISRWESFDPNRPLDMFSFADSSRLGQSELKEIILSLKEENIPTVLFVALRRGIAVHHAGMNRRYRQVVEILFRKGYLTAVVATGTLALGINMPCKTVAFTGDSAFLSTLNYRQGAGRAGRRGFDLLGNVVFTNISLMRAHELISFRLPDLKGHFPLTTTLVLRVLGFIDAAGQSDFAAGIVKSLLTQNRLYLGGAEAGKSVQHHLRFSIEYLQRQHLLSSDGRPINFAGLVGHLYFTENAVFAFHSLLKGGYFHRLCSGIWQDTKGTLRTLGLVMAHLFNRIQTAPSGAGSSQKAHADSDVPSLPRLPTEAEDLLVRHNNETLEVFKTYASTYVDQYLDDTPDRHLPFSRIAVGGEKPRMLHLPGALPPTRLRSPFSALSGHSDDFKSIRELCSNIRSGVFLEESAVPYIPIWPRDLSTPLNSYIYDFFAHGEFAALRRENKIRDGDVWFLLKDFYLVLATIVASLTNFIRSDATTDDVDMIDLQDVGETPDEHPAVSDADADARKDEKHAPAVRPKAKQKKVADSWDDEDEDEESGGDDNGDGSDKGVSGGARAPSKPAHGTTRPDIGIPTWEKDGQGLVHVLAAFTMLRDDFDEKFRKNWS